MIGLGSHALPEAHHRVPDPNCGPQAVEIVWLDLQSRYELEVERDRLAGTLDQIEPLASA